MPDFSSGPKLPRALLDQVEKPNKNHSARRARDHLPTNRKDRRKLERVQKRQGTGQHALHAKRRAASKENHESSSDRDETEEEEHNAPLRPQARGLDESSSKASSLRKAASRTVEDAKKIEQEPQTGTHRPVQTSHKAKPREVAEDAEIAALEKKLGIKGRKTPNLSNEDGLGDLLGGLDVDEEYSGRKRKRAEDEIWLRDKRARSATRPIERESEGESSAETEDTLGRYEQGLDGSSEDGEGLNSDVELEESSAAADTSSFEGFDPQPPKMAPPPNRQRENPYVAPKANNIEPSVKYVPPSLRTPPSSDVELQQRIRRQMQGQLNRLSEANLLSILSEVSIVYRSNPRQFVTSTLIDLLLNLIADRTALSDPFIILHAGFIAATYKMQGQDFGAQMLEQIINRFDHFYATSLDKEDVENSKEVINLISLLSQLYNLHVTGSELIFSLLRTFLSGLSSIHTELLLRLVRSSGAQLRSDDPSALRDIVLLLQRTIAINPERTLSVRTKFMIDTITDLKNNKLKAGAASSALTAEHLVHMKKTLGSLNQRADVKATEPLRLTLEDIRNADKKGKWWLVGAGWKGRDATTQGPEDPNGNANNRKDSTVDVHHDAIDGDELDSTATTDLTTVARANNMTTPLRRSIFITLLTSADYINAHTRLLKLSLTRAQELEIPRVVLHCVSTEEAYNPYYALVAGRLCAGDRKGRLAKAFGGGARVFLKKLRRIGGAESDDDDDEENGGDDGSEGEVALSAIVNQAKFQASLVNAGHVSIGMLKPLHLRHPKPNIAIFAEVFLVTLLLHVKLTASAATHFTTAPTHVSSDGTGNGSGPPSVTELFIPVLASADFAKHLAHFLRKVVRSSDLVRGESEKKRLRRAVDAVLAERSVVSGTHGPGLLRDVG